MLSLFVMDVSGSTKYDNTEEISNYLIKLTEHIPDWSRASQYHYVNYRMGDELFFVSDSISTTLLVSYYIKLMWPFKKQPVKFGIAIGDVSIPKQDPEHWNDPLIKSARTALNSIKSSDITDFCLASEIEDVQVYNDVVFPYLTEIIRQHSDVQQHVLLLDCVYPQQKDIAVAMDKSISTISEHLKKAHKKQLNLIKNSLERLDKDEDNIKVKVIDHIHQNIKEVFI